MFSSAGEAPNAAVDFFCQRLRSYKPFLINTKKGAEKKHLIRWQPKKKNDLFSLCRPHFLVGFFLASSIPLKSWPYRWLRQVWHQRSQHMGPSWKLGKPCRARRPGLFRLQTQILCVARNSLGTDFKSSRRKRPYVIMLIMLIFVMGGGLFWGANSESQENSSKEFLLQWTCNSLQFSDAKTRSPPEHL